MTTWIRAILLGVALGALACSEHDEGHTGNDPHAGHDAGAGGSGGSGASGSGGASGAGAGGGATATPLAPQLDELMPMAGSLHVMWLNKEPACDTIEGERKSGSEDFKVAFSVPGEVDNKHDIGATEGVSYTYRLRCQKGGVFSAYSNELSRNPKE